MEVVLVGRLRFVRRLPGQQFHQDHGQGPQVGACVDLLALGKEAELFGRGIAQLADEDPGARLRDRLRVLELGHAEVDDLDRAVGREHQILGADVSMDDAGAVDGVEAVQRGDDDANRFARRQRAASAEAL
jgi:hypothetical protein